MIELLKIVTWLDLPVINPELWTIERKPSSTTRSVIGIQTRIGEHLCHQAGLSSPFHQPVSAAVRCGHRSAPNASLYSCSGDRCLLEHGHAGAHVYQPHETPSEKRARLIAEANRLDEMNKAYARNGGPWEGAPMRSNREAARQLREIADAIPETRDQEARP